jgi:predicted alpha/beta-fold hydrolase
MTVFGLVARIPLSAPATRERWELPDGDFLDVDRHPGAGPDAPLVIACHGLEGSGRAGYVRSLALAARTRGLAMAALNFRGCSGELNRLPRFYHSGDTGDLAHAVERLVAERPGRPLLLAGFSVGGNVVSKYLGERGDDLPAEVRGGAVVSVPFDLAACAQTLDGPGTMTFLYRERFLRSLRKKALAKAPSHPDALDWNRARGARTFAAFDEGITAPLHGFGGAEEYWNRSSSGPLLGGVRRPLLILAALDDPFIPNSATPVALAQSNRCISLESFDTGGHVAFVSGSPIRPRFWAEERMAQFLGGLVGPPP